MQQRSGERPVANMFAEIPVVEMWTSAVAQENGLHQLISSEWSMERE